MTTRDPFGKQRARLLEEGATLPWAAIWQRLAATRAALIGATLGGLRGAGGLATAAR